MASAPTRMDDSESYLSKAGGGPSTCRGPEQERKPQQSGLLWFLGDVTLLSSSDPACHSRQEAENPGSVEIPEGHEEGMTWLHFGVRRLAWAV